MRGVPIHSVSYHVYGYSGAFSVQACQSSRFTESLLEVLPFNNRDWVFANGHQTATSGQFQGSCAVMQTECQIGLSAAAAIMPSYCRWHILQEKKEWSESRFSCVTLYCVRVQAATIWKLPRPCGKWHFPRGVKKSASLHICFSSEENTAASTCHCQVLSLAPFLALTSQLWICPRFLCLSPAPVTDAKKAARAQRKRRGLHDPLADFANICSLIVLGPIRVIIIMPAL